MEVLFYQITDTNLPKVLGGLLEKCLDRKWRVVVQAGNEEARDMLDTRLWTYRSDSFLPHAASGEATTQPIWLTTGQDNPNNASVRFMVDGANPPDLSAYERGVFLFDGNNPSFVAQARKSWELEKSAGHQITCWQQDADGRWVERESVSQVENLDN